MPSYDENRTEIFLNSVHLHLGLLRFADFGNEKMPPLVVPFLGSAAWCWRVFCLIIAKIPDPGLKKTARKVILHLMAGI